MSSHQEDPTPKLGSLDGNDREATGPHFTVIGNTPSARADKPSTRQRASSTTQQNSSSSSAKSVSGKSKSSQQYTISPSGVPLPTLPGMPSVPGYEVTSEIARGGMGVVMVARDISLDREVAIKTLLSSGGDSEETQWALARFLAEAKITARLQHPGIPPIHQLGELSDGRPFLVMKLIRGRTLATILAAREQRVLSQSAEELEMTSLESPGLLHIFEQICHAVGYAHSQGVIHRDLKPANIMVGKFGEVQVMDWGLAKSGVKNSMFDMALEIPSEADQRAGPKTRRGHAMGTPQYMAPEQARGAWDEVNSRADVFALGGIFAAILTGQPPYSGSNPMAVLRRAQAGDLGECFARLDCCGVDEELIALAKRCLSPNAKQRPGNGAEVAKQLAAYRLGVENRLIAAERESAVAAARAEEARLQAAAEHEAKQAAEERAVEAERRTVEAREQYREQYRRKRGVFIGVAAILIILSGTYGNYLARRSCEPCCPPPAEAEQRGPRP